MKMNKLAFLAPLTALALLAAPVAALSCELGMPESTRNGEYVQPIIDVDGKLVGYARLRSDGEWEGVVEGLGVLNEAFPSAQWARAGVCEELGL
ncbi:MAG: hypothetical protein ACK4VV_02780 [Pseudomonas sp.]